jgi:hypothetical protein
MKLYHFNPHTWGQEFYVVTDSEKNAIKALKEFLKKDENKWIGKWGSERFKRYTIDVIEPNVIIHSEIS